VIQCFAHNLSRDSLHAPETAKAKGGEIVKAYELLIMNKPTLDEEAVTAIVERAKTLITAEGGVVDNVDDWGKRPLAYEIDKLKDGYYVLIDFHHDPHAIAEIERVLRITDGIMRYMLVGRQDKE